MLSHALRWCLVARVLLISCNNITMGYILYNNIIHITSVLLGGYYGTPGGCYVAIRLLCWLLLSQVVAMRLL